MAVNLLLAKITIAAKIITKTFLQKQILEAINFVIITKHPAFGWKRLEKDHENLTQIIVSGNYFVAIRPGWGVRYQKNLPIGRT